MTLLLIVIYITFISLGLPDPLVGAAWPVMYRELGANLSDAGILTMLTSGCTIISTFFTSRLVKWLGRGKLLVVSVGLTAISLLGFSFATSFWQVVLLSIPMGLGAGAVDAVINNYVAVNYNARQMNWLHCSYGVGVTIGPLIISFFLLLPGGWHTGYQVVSAIQWAIFLMLVLALPLWEKNAKHQEEQLAGQIEDKHIFKRPAVIATFPVLFFYCAVEVLTGVWTSTYFVETRNYGVDAAAMAASAYFGGIMVGRMVAGFLSGRFNNVQLIRLGIAVSLAGNALLFIPSNGLLPAVGVFLIGLGFAPIYPAMIKETPARFGALNSQKIIGVQMSFAYIGITLVPMLFGKIFGSALNAFPYVTAILILGILLTSEFVLRLLKKDKSKQTGQNN